MERIGHEKGMSAELEKIKVSGNASFHIGMYQAAHFERPWHFHPEFELLLITKGYGTRMVGDHFEEFTVGDLVLLGSNLPHAWISDSDFTKKESTLKCESIFVQFKKSVFGTHFIDIPELQSLRVILQRAERGVKVLGAAKEIVSQTMQMISGQNGLEQLLMLIRMLDTIQHGQYEQLASEEYIKNQVHFKSDKMNKIHHFIMQHFKSELNIQQCADFAKMTNSSFCRFFKKHTNVTFSVYLNYIRINLAQTLLKNTDLAIKEIAFECGYTSVIYFNQKFKASTGMAPKEYRIKSNL